MEPGRERSPVAALRVLPLGPFPTSLAEGLVAALSRRVRVPCELLEGASDPELPMLPDRAQVHADELLRRLEALPTDDRSKLVGVTLHDMTVPIFTFLFGRARLDGPAALVSLARLKPEFYGMPADVGLTHRRAVAEILHEVGHTLGLRHCQNYSCLMYFSHDVETVDLRGLSFCPTCASLLPPGFMAPGRPRA